MGFSRRSLETGFNLILIIWLLANGWVFGQKSQEPRLIPFWKGKHWGYADRNRNLVIAPVYDEAQFFQGTVAKVRLNQKWALINEKGRLLTEPKYHQIEFQNGDISFREDKRLGLLDTTGREILSLPPAYQVSYSYSNNGTLQFIEDRAIVYLRNNNPTNTNFYIDRQGNFLNTSPKGFALYPFYQGFAKYSYTNQEGFPRTTLIDKTGKEVLSARYEFQDTVTINHQTYFLIRTPQPYFKDEEGQVQEKNERLKYGLLNSKLEEVIPVKFYAISASGGFVVVRDWFNKAGFWNLEKRKKLTRRRYDHIQVSSHPSRAVVTSLSKTGLMDSTGHWVLPLAQRAIQLENYYRTSYPQFRQLGLKTPYLFYVWHKKKKTALDPFGQPLPVFNHGYLDKITDSLMLIKAIPIAPVENSIANRNRGEAIQQLGLMNSRGEVLVPLSYKFFLHRPQNKLIILSSDTLVSYFTETGKKLADRPIVNSYMRGNQQPENRPAVITPQELAVNNLQSCYHVQQALTDGFTIVGTNCQFRVKSYGVLDKAGKISIPFFYNEIYPHGNDLLFARQADKWFVFRPNGIKVLETAFDALIPLENGNFLTGIYSQHIEVWVYGIVNPMFYQLRNSAGIQITDDIFLSAPNFKENTAWVQVAGGSVKIDKAGKILARSPSDLSRLEKVQPGIYRVYDQNTWEFIDMNGKTVIPAQFTQTTPFSEGLAAVEKNVLWGYINKNGEVVIPFKYQQALPFYKGKAFVRVLNDFQLINKQGKTLSAETYEDVRPFEEGLAAVKRSNRWGFINEKEQVVIPYKYTQVSDFQNGMAVYSLNYWQGYLNKNGLQVVPPRYYNLQPFGKNTGWMERYSKWYLANRKGQLVDSTSTKPYKEGMAVERGFWKNNRLFLNTTNQLTFKNLDGSDRIIGTFSKFEALSEGLIAVKRNSAIWYYLDEAGNRYFEKE